MSNDVYRTTYGRTASTIMVSVEEGGRETVTEMDHDLLCPTAKELWRTGRPHGRGLAEHHMQCDECTIRAVMES